jgi:predicted Zn-dependent protease
MVGLAAAAAGSPQAGVAIAHGAGHVANRQLLKHSRTHEEAADQAALDYLDANKKTAIGLLELLELLYSKENELYTDLNQYALTHPLSRQRIAHVKNHIDNSKINLIPPNKQDLDSFSRSITKLNAFLLPSEETLAKYPKSDNSINARYARAIAYYKIPNIENAINEMDELLKIEPENPFFNELKGQILFENGKINESILYYTKANKHLPDSALLKIILATAQIASQNEDMRLEAINNIESSLLEEKENSFAWRQLAIAYGRGNNLGMSNLALAEESFLLDNKKMVRKFLDIANKYLKEGSPAKLRAKDLMDTINKNEL